MLSLHGPGSAVPHLWKGPQQAREAWDIAASKTGENPWESMKIYQNLWKMNDRWWTYACLASVWHVSVLIHLCGNLEGLERRRTSFDWIAQCPNFIHPAPRGVAAHTAGYFGSYTLNSSALLWTPRGGGGGGGGGCRRGCRRRRRRGRRAHAEPSCAQRKLMSCHVTPSWAHRGLMLCQVVPCWAILGRCSAHVGLCWAHLGPILGPSGVFVGSMLRLCWPMLGLCWPILADVAPMLGLCWPLLGLGLPMWALCWASLGLCWA